MTNIDPVIVEAVRAHQTIATGLGEWCCKCTPMEWRPVVRRSEHVATALAPLIAAAVDAARAEAWDEGYTAGISAPANRALGLGNPANPYREATP